MKKRTKKLLGLGLLAAPTLAQAQLRSVQLLGPEKSFGYVVGDVLGTDAILTVTAGTTLDRQSLPVAGPLNAAVELRHVDATQIQRGDMSEIRIHSEYQSFFAPERVTETELPGFTIRLETGSKITTASIPAFPFQVSPLRATQQSVADLTQLRPNHDVKPLPSQNLPEQIIASMALALAAGLTFAHTQGWLPIRRGKQLPFAIAARNIQRLCQHGKPGADIFRLLHQAFDATAGQKLFSGELPDFIKSHPQFAPARDEIEAFFDTSQSWFFAREQNSEQPSQNLLKLARKLRRLEQRP